MILEIQRNESLKFSTLGDNSFKNNYVFIKGLIIKILNMLYNEINSFYRKLSLKETFIYLINS